MAPEAASLETFSPMDRFAHRQTVTGLFLITSSAPMPDLVLTPINTDYLLPHPAPDHPVCGMAASF